MNIHGNGIFLHGSAPSPSVIDTEMPPGGGEGGALWPFKHSLPRPPADAVMPACDGLAGAGGWRALALHTAAAAAPAPLLPVALSAWAEWGHCISERKN